MNRLHLALVLGLFLGPTSCGPSVRLYSDTEETGTFETYHTYTFQEFSEGNKKTISAQELEALRTNIARELEKRGFDYAPEGGDVSVRVTVYHRNGYAPYPGYRMRPETQRAIAVDMYENRRKLHVWHAAAVGPVVYDAEKRTDQFPEVAARIFQRYPVPAMGPGTPVPLALPETAPEIPPETVPGD
ncbi:MAG: DUF4136 domain-containing protein [Bacteroidales bacterium]